jgi:hypothetical protein
MIIRQRHIRRIRRLFESHPVVAILGVRQVGKTTLASQIAGGTGGATPDSTSKIQPTSPSWMSRYWRFSLSMGSW